MIAYVVGLERLGKFGYICIEEDITGRGNN